MALIKVRALARKSPMSEDVKYYANAVLYSRIGKDQIVDCAQRNSQIPRAYISMCFDALVVEIKNFLMNGHSITLDHLGSIGCTIQSKGATTAALFDASMIYKVHFTFRAAPNLRRLLARADYEYIKP